MKIAKRILSMCLVLILAISCVAFADDEGRLITVFVDGKQINFDVNPVLDNGRTLVPMRFIFEALGATVGWDDATQTATAVKGNITIAITINKPELIKNNEVILLDVPAKLVNDRTLVPVRAVSEGMDAKVEWIDETSQVIITTSSHDGPYMRSELSPDDMSKFSGNTDKYMKKFTEKVLPDAVKENTNLSAKILEKDEATLEYVRNLWIEAIISEIKDIQDISEDVYEYSSTGSTPESIIKSAIADYVSLVEKIGLGNDNVIKSSKYIDVDDSVMLSTEYVAPGSDKVSYIGILALADGTIEYKVSDERLFE